jgi:hypothetical protein
MLVLVMHASVNGGDMEGTHTQPAPYELRPATHRVRGIAAAIGSVLAEAVAAGIRGDDFDRAFSSSPDAQFAVLPTSSKQRLLDRGFRA